MEVSHTNKASSPPEITAEAANNSPIGILGKIPLDVEVNSMLKSNQEFYLFVYWFICLFCKQTISEIILGLDWSLNDEVIVDTSRILG